jgi:transposase
MRVIHKRCCGLDVHKDTVVACVRIVERGEVRTQVRTFATTTRGLHELKDCLSSQGVRAAAMEATGVYWKPVWHILEESCALTLANAAQVKQMPGRKTDVNDATWLAELLAHGLIRSSFVPPEPIQHLRDLTRTRKQLVEQRSQHELRIQKVLEDCNIKVGSHLTHLFGKSGRAILDAMAAGETDASELVAHISTRVKADREVLQQSLEGRITEHHRFLVKLHLEQIDALDRMIEQVEARAREALGPFREQLEQQLTSIPGVSETVAHAIIAEIGVDMSQFPTAEHLCSWAGLCPRQDESAGKRRSTRTRPGNRWLKSMLVQGALAGARKKDSYLRTQYHRIKARRGPKKAAIAVAATLLGTVFHMLRDGTLYQDLGPVYLDRLHEQRSTRNAVRRLEALGYRVDLQKAA